MYILVWHINNKPTALPFEHYNDAINRAHEVIAVCKMEGYKLENVRILYVPSQGDVAILVTVQE